MDHELQLLIRLLVAAALAGLLGWERESARKSAGPPHPHARRHRRGALYLHRAARRHRYPCRLGELPGRSDRAIQAVAIGIGFLGSGVIFMSRTEDRVYGLTTAASVWATAAIGIAAGLERYILAVGATILLLFVLRALARFDMSD